MSANEFTEMAISWLTLRLDAASRHCLAQNSPHTQLSLHLLSRLEQALEPQACRPPFLHWFAARPPEDSDTGAELTLQPKAGSELSDSPTSDLHRSWEQSPVPCTEIPPC